MASIILTTFRPMTFRNTSLIAYKRLLTTNRAPSTASSAHHPPPSAFATPSSSSSSDAPLTHYKITLQRSAISLPTRVKATLESLGIHRRLQTVFHPHNPINAGKILRVKELVSVENVPAHEVRTKTELRRERKASRGYVVSRSKLWESL